VADIDELAVVDIAKAQVTERLKAPGAQFLNDVEVGPGGAVYVSDTLTNTIYQCAAGKDCQVFLKSEALESPNGLLLDGGKLVVAAWGVGIDPATFATKTPGRLLEVDLKTKAVKPVGDGKPVGNLDGIEKDGSDYLVTDWMAGKLLRITRKGAVTVLKDGFKNSADLGYDAKTHRAVVPDMGADTVLILQITR
jgi:sugar lactone lactonase YvrE